MSLKSIEQFVVSLKVCLKKKHKCLVVKSSPLLFQLCNLLCYQGLIVGFSKFFKNNILYLKILLNDNVVLKYRKNHFYIRCFFKDKFKRLYKNDFFHNKYSINNNYTDYLFIYTTSSGLFTRHQLDYSFSKFSKNNVLLLVIEF